MAKLEIHAYGNLAEYIRTARSRLLGVRGLLESLAKRLRFSFQKNIAEGRSPEGTPYSPLKRPIRKQVRRNDPRPLIDTGTLVNSFAYQFVGQTSVIVGDPTRYGIYHQTGTVHVPQRAFIGIRSSDESDMRLIVPHWTGYVFGIFDAPDANVFTDSYQVF